MGGNALKLVATRRLPAVEYHALAQAIARDLGARFGARVLPIPAYRSKADFGDLDLLVEKEKVLGPEGERDALDEFVSQYGHARQVLANGPVLSYDHRADAHAQVGFQVDLILAPAREMEISQAYYSYNDLGNLVGRIAHKMGFTYGHRGLLLPVRSGTRQAAVLDVSMDPERCLAFLGYDPVRFRAGFWDRQEIYEYASSSPYFNPEIFLLENRNHTSRTRDRKRPTYMGFLEYIQALPTARTYFEFPEDKSQWLPSAFRAFPGLEEKYLQVQEAIALAGRVKPYFNGDLVGQWTGLSGKSLGRFFANAQQELGGTASLAAILDAEGPAAIRERVLDLFARAGNKNQLNTRAVGAGHSPLPGV